MKVKLIAAVNKTGGIGYQNRIPWHLPEDLQYFKGVTMGHPVIMGRNTFDSLPFPLPGRKNIVVTTRPFFYQNPHLVVVVDSYEEALRVAEQESTDTVFIIGGVSAYQAFWQLADELYLTRVDVHTPYDALLDLQGLQKDWTLTYKDNNQSKKEPFLKYSHEVYKKNQLDLLN
jgi:dihydrofolate reductase